VSRGQRNGSSCRILCFLDRTDSSLLNINGSLAHSKEGKSSHGEIIFDSSTQHLKKNVELNPHDFFLSSLQHLSLQTFQLSLLFGLTFSVQVRAISFFPCMLSSTVFQAWEMSARHAPSLHQVTSLSRSANLDSSDKKKLYSLPSAHRTLKVHALEVVTSLRCAVGVVFEQLLWQKTALKTTSIAMTYSWSC
jgi:hypothetical protein